VAAGELGLGERQDHPPLDDLLRLLHSLQRIPEAGADQLAAELDERAGGGGRRQQVTLEVAKLVRAAIAALPEVAGELLTPLGDRSEGADATLRDASLELLEQPLRDHLLVSALGAQAQPIDPSGERRECRQHRAVEPSVGVGDEHDRSLVTQQADRLFDGDSAAPGFGDGRLFPELEDLRQVLGSVVADEHRRSIDPTG
jgi:hypothetical protein